MASISDEQFRQVVEQTFKLLSFQYNINLQPGSPLRLFLESTINAIMRGERDVFLSNLPDNKANGFYSRFFDTTIGKL